MKNWIFLTIVICGLVLSLVAPLFPGDKGSNNLILEGETHFKHMKQITFGGENAEAYFNKDASLLSFQSKRDGARCDAIYLMNTDGSNVRKISGGKGVTTCAFIFPGREKLLYASTHADMQTCPPPPDYSKGYVWPLHAEYDIYTADFKGKILQRLTHTGGYDAEAVLSPDGKKIIFTSVRDGDLELYTMDPDGKNVKRITHRLGYDGGAFFSPDGKKIVWRAHYPETEKAKKDFKDLLKQNLVKPSRMEIWIANADGTGAKQITNNGAANFAPYYHPDGKRIILCSNMADKKGRNCDLWMIDSDGKKPERITYNPTFDGFPMFSHDGKTLVLASNRNNKIRGETNVFIVKWRD
jgi:Tol biopolymer transport system component